MVLLSGFALHYLFGRPRVMDEVQVSNKKHICIHTIKCLTKERQVSLNKDLEFPPHVPHKQLRSTSLKKTKKKHRHIHAFSQLTTALYDIMTISEREYCSNVLAIGVKCSEMCFFLCLWSVIEYMPLLGVDSIV